MKKKKALILTLGFDEKFCYRAILRHGIKEGDKIVVFSASKEERVKKAFEMIKNFVEKSYGREVEIRFFEVDVKQIAKAINFVQQIIREYKHMEIIANLSGGMRALVIVVLFALLLESENNVSLEIELEDFSGIVELPKALLNAKLIFKELSYERKKILKHISQGCSTIEELCSEISKDETTLRRHVAVLEKLGMINVEKRKPLKFKITETGKLFL